MHQREARAKVRSQARAIGLIRHQVVHPSPFPLVKTQTPTFFGHRAEKTNFSPHNTRSFFRFLFCGTNAFTPVCRDYADERASFVQRGQDRKGIGVAPFDPNHNSTAVLVGDDVFAGTVADFAGVDSIIFRKPLRTQQYDSVQLNSPDFVGSFAHEVNFEFGKMRFRGFLF